MYSSQQANRFNRESGEQHHITSKKVTNKQVQPEAKM
jgi:hypothetical protein